MPVRRGPCRMPARCLHGDAGDNTDNAGDNTDDTGAMIRGAIRECVKAPLGFLFFCFYVRKYFV